MGSKYTLAPAKKPTRCGALASRAGRQRMSTGGAFGANDGAVAAARVLCDFAERHAAQLWPGYTHLRRAMPSTMGLWAAALCEGIIDTLESWPALWAQVDRCPLGSAAGYGAPLPLQREVAADALGFGGLVHAVTSVQNGRGKLEAAVLGFCTQLGHDLSRLACDVCLYAAEEYGYFVLPGHLATGSSMMPHKRNPDLFELTRARAAALDGDLTTVLMLKGKLTSGYHRDAQLLKEPLFRGLCRTREMLEMMAFALPALQAPLLIVSGTSDQHTTWEETQRIFAALAPSGLPFIHFGVGTVGLLDQMKDDGRAVLIGTNSYGKGTVQNIKPLPNQGEIKLTWARFHAPSGYTLHHLGVLPSICTAGQHDSGKILDELSLGELPSGRIS